MMPQDVGMAPLHNYTTTGARRATGGKYRLRGKKDLFARQDGGSTEDNDGRRRFGFGNNNGNGGEGKDDGGEGRGGKPRFGFGGFRNGDKDEDGEDGRGGRRFGFGGFGGFGGGRGRNGKNEDGNNGNDNSSKPSNSAEQTPPTPASSEPPPSSTPPSEATSSPEPTTSPEPTQPTEVSVSVTADPSSTINQGVALLQSALSPTSTAEANPTVTAFIPLMTQSEGADPSNLSGAGENREPPNVSLSSGAEPTISSGPTPTLLPSGPPTPGQPDNGQDSGTNSNNNKSNGDSNANTLEAPRGMNPTAERILISVGSIGGFILACFVIWMVWRTMKSKKNGGRRSGGSLGLLPRRIASKVSFLKRRGWKSLDDSTPSKSPPPSYQEKVGGGSAPSMEGFFSPEKSQPQQQRQQQLPQLQPLRIPESMLVQHPSHPNQVYQSPVDRSNIYGIADALTFTGPTNMPAYFHQQQESFSSTNAAQFGAIQTGTAPTMYYTQPLIPQPYPATYNPVHHQPARTVSDISSLSSGFGDGDIIVSDTLVTPSPQTLQLPSPFDTPPRGGGPTARFSWSNSSHLQGRSRSNSGSSHRETVCTETSEDRPARFRSLTSWVDQQTGRIQRVQQREENPIPSSTVGNPGIPGIHNPPGEQSFGMMMGVGEERVRRVDEAGVGGRVG